MTDKVARLEPAPQDLMSLPQGNVIYNPNTGQQEFQAPMAPTAPEPFTLPAGAGRPP